MHFNACRILTHTLNDHYKVSGNTIYHLAQFGFLKVSGIDARKFLQGYTTCELPADESEAKIGAICNIKGRMLTSFIVIRQGDDLILRMPKALVAITLKFLSKYIVFSKAKLEDISERLACYGVIESTSNAFLHVVNSTIGIEIHLKNRIEHWRSTPLDEVELNCGAWHQAELSEDLAWVTEETSELFLPQMLNYHLIDAVDFKKGCYLGQEIVARMQYRGTLKRRLHRITSDRDYAPGTTLSPHGQVVASAPTTAPTIAPGGYQILAVLENHSVSSTPIQFDDGYDSIAELIGNPTA